MTDKAPKKSLVIDLETYQKIKEIKWFIEKRSSGANVSMAMAVDAMVREAEELAKRDPSMSETIRLAILSKALQGG